ncbi:MAG: dihydrofolate reductase [Clostridiales bacterium]|nr:dihydrofolate reductase [Clostridiales bacterium]
MNMIVAVDRNWGIGRNNDLLASIPGDMKYFKDHTLGKVVVMGRKTLESMPGGKGLPKRSNIVLTSNKNLSADRCTIVNSEDEMFSEISKYNSEDVYLIGGASMYNRYYSLCDKLYITKIDADLDADSFIINIDEDEGYKIISQSEPMTENGISYSFLVYEKINIKDCNEEQ